MLLCVPCLRIFTNQVLICRSPLNIFFSLAYLSPLTSNLFSLHPTPLPSHPFLSQPSTSISGLNPSQFKSSVAYDETDEPSLLLTSKDEADETYKDCEPLQFDCPKCKGTNMYSADCLREKAPVLVCASGKGCA